MVSVDGPVRVARRQVSAARCIILDEFTRL